MAIKHVLVVDDSKSARFVLRKMLQAINLLVDMAESAEEALSYLATTRPDAIFLDHTMPGMSGLQALKVIKDNPQTTNIPVAMYTSKEEDGYIDQVKAGGGVGILPKPATADALNAIMRELNAAIEVAREKTGPVAGMVTPEQLGVASKLLENIARATANAVVDSAIQARLLPLIEEKLAGFSKAMSVGSESVIRQIASSVYESQASNHARELQRMKAQLVGLEANLHMPGKLDQGLAQEVREMAKVVAVRQAEETAQAIAEQTAKDVATTLTGKGLDVRVNEISRQLTGRLETQFAVLRKLQTPDKLDPKLAEQVKETAQTVAVRQAEETAQATAEQTANKVLKIKTEEIFNQLARHIGARFAKRNAEWEAPDKLDPRLMEELREMAQAIAVRQAVEMAQAIGERWAVTITDDVSVLTRALIKRVYKILGLTMVINLLLIGILYYVK